MKGPLAGRIGEVRRAFQMGTEAQNMIHPDACVAKTWISAHYVDYAFF